MKKQVFGVMMLLLIASAAWADSGTPGYVYSTVNGSGWIDAGANPAWGTNSYAYSNVAPRWFLNYPEGGGTAVYRFQAPAGKFIDATQLAIAGWTYGGGNAVNISYNNIAAASAGGGGDYYLNASKTLTTPVKTLDVRFQGINGWDPGDPDLTRVYTTYLETGNSYQFAAHTINAKTDYTIHTDASKQFSITGPANAFTDWAVYNFGATGDMQTVYQSGSFYTGGDNNSGWGRNYSMDIPFTFDSPLATGRLNFSSSIYGYGSNWGYVKLEIVTDQGVTPIYQRQSPDYANPENFNYNGPVNSGSGQFASYTDIDALIAGKTNFTLRMSGYVGWSGWFYNGGQFFPTDMGDAANFGFSGTVVPEPVTLALLSLGGLALIRRKK